MSDTKDYGEPWRVNQDGVIKNRHGKVVSDLPNGHRAVLCVNALEEMHPKRLRGLINAAEDVILDFTWRGKLRADAPHEVHVLKAALDALRGDL
jgi:hypothetical protein